MLCSCVCNNLLSFFFLICVFYAWPLFVHLSVFTSRSCSSPSLCWFLQIFDQTLTAGSVRQTMQRPKVRSHHAWPILLSFFLFRPCTLTHAHTLTLLNRISVSQCRPAPCSRWMMPEKSLLLHLLLFLFLSSALPGALKPCAIWQRRLGPGQISPKQTSPSLAIKITSTRTFTDLF